MMNDLSKVDGSLDWRYEPASGEGATWTLEQDAKIYEIVLVGSSNAGMFDIEGYKTMKGTGNKTREKAKFRKGLAFGDAQKEVKEMLKSYE